MERPTDLTPNDLESIRQAASDRGDCDTSSLANVAMWGAGMARATARRKLAAEFADDEVTVRIPRETLAQVAAEWIAMQRREVQ